MKTKHPVAVIVASVFTATILVPAFTVWILPANKEAKPASKSNVTQTQQIAKEENTEPTVAVFRTSSKTTEEYKLEDYIVGVVASEMPADFELEALKAQALAARTYIVKAKITNGPSTTVTDSVKDQVYKNDAELRAAWGTDYDQKIKKIRKAVESTKGKIMTFNNEPITASFFSTSNGRTENSSDYWSGDVPYLKSVDSHWDVGTPKFNADTTMSVATFNAKLGVKLTQTGTVAHIIERTDGQRIASVKIAGKTFTGRQVREKLGLRSSDFDIIRSGNQVKITTKGYGHGVGMSQYGANGMAKEGKTYEEIVKHYYQGIAIVEDKALLNRLVVKK